MKNQPVIKRIQNENRKIVQDNNKLNVQGINIDPTTARRAIVLSEVIRPPVSKRRRER